MILKRKLAATFTVLLVAALSPAQSAPQVNITAQRLQSTSMQETTGARSIKGGIPVKALQPLTVTCPGTRVCTFEFTTTAQIADGNIATGNWGMMASVDGTFADGSGFVVGFVPTNCCEQRTTELFLRGVLPGPHEVQMWVVSPATPATLIYRSMTVRVFQRE
jgi:hypothetical protein